jgi:hypothetical protein
MNDKILKMLILPRYCEKKWPREEDHLGDFTRAKRLKNLVKTEIAMDAV